MMCFYVVREMKKRGGIKIRLFVGKECCQFLNDRPVKSVQEISVNVIVA